ncbi:MAG: hypothetical protein R2813_07470 [Flavobacteriales bacterium]
MLLLFAVFMVSGSAIAQDFGTVGEEKAEGVEKTTSDFLDPYRLTLRIRPLSYLLYPMTSGNMGSFNGRVDYAISRNFALGVELNYYYNYVWPNAGLDFSWELTSIRIDANYFIFKESNEEKYAEGFHLGPYLKFKMENRAGVGVLNTIGVSRLVGNALIGGGLLGYQVVKNRFVFDPHIGLGGGIGSYNIGGTIHGDFRLGLSIGMVVLK